MWFEFFTFDLRYQRRQPLLWITTAALVAVAFFSAGSDSARIGGAIGNIHLNAPVVIARLLAILSFISMFLVTVFIAGSVLRDSEVGIADMIFATPMRKRDYLAGRFLAGFCTCLLIFVLITLALIVGAHRPSIDPARLGAFSLQAYGWSFAVFIVPNLLFVAALLMLLAAITRSLILVYVGVLAFVVLWSIAGLLVGDLRNDWLAVMLDPFGIRAPASMTRYYTAQELNTRMPDLSGFLLLNRLLWSGIALGLFAATLRFFKPQRMGSGRRLFGKPARIAAPAATPAGEPGQDVLRAIEPRFDRSTAWAQCWSIFCFDAKAVLKSVPFLVMLLMALLNVCANVTIDGMRFDSSPYPLTRLMLDSLSGGYNFILVIILAFYSGELIFQERQAKIADVCDAMPVPNWAPLAAKCAALVGVIAVFLGVGVVAAIAYQLYKGGAPIEGGLYLEGIALASTYFVLIGLCALALQVFSNHKFIGYLLVIALLFSDGVLDGRNLNLRLYHFASLPALPYSDMNGYGHFLNGWSWYALYWSLLVLALLIGAQAFAVRGLSQGWGARLRLAAKNLRGGAGIALALSLAGCASCGAWIYYNTTVLNRFQANDLVLDDQASYEKQYRRYKDLPHPRITDIRAEVDIYPAERRVDIRGHYVLRNKTAAPLDTLRIQCDRGAETVWLNLPPHQVTLEDKTLCFSIIKLAQPLAPGASLPLDFSVKVRNPGFTNGGKPDGINYNGSFFTDRNYFPKFGYDVAMEIEDRNARRERGLGEQIGLAGPDDKAAGASSFYNIEADWINFDTTVSTSADQTALAPGDLLESWEKGGRRYFYYKADKPMVPFIAYLSAHWQLRRADWNGIPIEVYYDEKHAYNVDNMIRGAQAALSYYTEQFGPYPYKQVRIAEFPRYLSYAQSFPNTIPFSESLGFINDLRDPDGVDHVFYVTAHEMAHQWWGEQAVAANVQGNGMVSESLAEYSALMVMEKAFGPEKVRHILRFDLDEYLAGRGKEMNQELPLDLAANQVYIQYRKGSLIFYRLRNEIGEAALNRALKHFLAERRYQSTPYATSRQLLDCIRAETPPEKQSLVTDMFEKIVIYDNRVVDAGVRRRPDGQWDVTMKLHLAKTEADGKGKETARAYDEPVEIAVFARAGNGKEKDEPVLFDEKRQLASGDVTLTVAVKEQPYEVGVDPYRLLIDRNAADNRKLVNVE